MPGVRQLTARVVAEARDGVSSAATNMDSFIVQEPEEQRREGQREKVRSPRREAAKRPRKSAVSVPFPKSRGKNGSENIFVLIVPKVGSALGETQSAHF